MPRPSIRIASSALSAALLLLGTLAKAADAVPDRRYVTVSGSGEVSAMPDRARLAMGVEVTKPQLKDAQAEANRIVRDYLAQARQLGVRDEDISTAGLSIRSEYDYPKPNTRRFLGYHVSRSLSVVVRDLDRIGDLLQRATDAGVNSVNDPVLESSKADELQRQALAKAATDARAKALVLAEAMNVKLGSIHNIEASNVDVAAPAPRMFAMAAKAAPESGNDEMGFNAGEIHYSATLTANFDLVP